MPESEEAKALKNADKGIAALESAAQGIEPLLKKMIKGEIDTGKTELVRKKASASLKKVAGVARLPDAKQVEGFSPKAKARLEAMAALIAEMDEMILQLKFARKQSRLDPETKKRQIVKALKPYRVEAKAAPPRFRKIVLGALKGEQVPGLEGEKFAFLPLSMVLWLIAQKVEAGVKALPR